MKEFYAVDAAANEGQLITSFFVVRSKEVRCRRTGQPYVHFLLADRTGVLPAKLWENPKLATSISLDDFIKVQGRVTRYQGRGELTIELLRMANSDEIDLADLVPVTTENIDGMWANLAEFIEDVQNLQIRQLLRAFYDDEMIAPGLRRAPAAKSYHHAFLGGLLEHTLSLCRLSYLVYANYPALNRDLLIAGAILHDIGKIHELTCERSITYTDRGQLVGHISLATRMLHEKATQLPHISSELITVIEHLILSHHGELQYGSPVEPALAEAVVLHFLDNLDSKLAAIMFGIDSAASDSNWTVKVALLGRRFLRLGLFLGDHAN